MSGWLKIPDNWLENDKIEELGAEAVLLHLSALALCSRQGSDGHVPARALRRLWPCTDLDTAVKRLQEADEWQTTDDGYYLPNWNVHLLAADEVERRRELSRTTSERYRRHKAGDHSMCDRCAAVKAGDTSRDVSVTPSVTRPRNATTRLDSERSERGEERRERADARSAGATRAPRVVVGEEPDPADLTPWDVWVKPNEYDDGGHSEVSVVPALAREDSDDGFTEAELEAGYDAYRELAVQVVAYLEAATRSLRATHRCSGLHRCGIDEDYLTYVNDVDPMLNVTVPTQLLEPWTGHVRAAVEAVVLSDQNRRMTA